MNNEWFESEDSLNKTLEPIQGFMDQDFMYPDPALQKQRLEDRLRIYAELLINTSEGSTEGSTSGGSAPEGHNNEAEMGRLHYQLGKTHDALKQYQAARSHYQAAIVLFETTQQLKPQAHALLLLGGLQDLLADGDDGDISEAIMSLEQAADLGERLNEPELQARALDSLGQLYEKARDWEKALQNYRSAEKLIGLSNGCPLTVSTHNMSLNSHPLEALHTKILNSIVFAQAQLTINRALELAERFNRPVSSPIEGFGLPEDSDPPSRSIPGAPRASRNPKGRPPSRR